MLNDFRRGFATYLANFTRSNYHQHRTEPTETTKDFDEKLRQYLDLKPVDKILEQWATKVSETCHQKWVKYTEHLIPQDKLEDIREPLPRKWHVFTSEESMIPIDDMKQLKQYNTVNCTANSDVTYRAMYLSDCADATFWGSWVAVLDQSRAHLAWQKITECLGADKFDQSVFGLVYEYASCRLSLVLHADQSDNRLLKIGKQFKKQIDDIEEVIYEVNERGLLIA